MVGGWSGGHHAHTHALPGPTLLHVPGRSCWGTSVATLPGAGLQSPPCPQLIGVSQPGQQGKKPLGGSGRHCQTAWQTWGLLGGECHGQGSRAQQGGMAGQTWLVHQGLHRHQPAGVGGQAAAPPGQCHHLLRARTWMAGQCCMAASAARAGCCTLRTDQHLGWASWVPCHPQLLGLMCLSHVPAPRHTHTPSTHPHIPPSPFPYTLCTHPTHIMPTLGGTEWGSLGGNVGGAQIQVCPRYHFP